MANEKIINLNLLAQYDSKIKEYIDKKSVPSGTIYKYMGSVNTYDELPTNAEIGHVYNVSSENGQNYAWTEAGWDSLGSTIDLTAYALKSDIENRLLDDSSTIDKKSIWAGSSGSDDPASILLKAYQVATDTAAIIELSHTGLGSGMIKMEIDSYGPTMVLNSTGLNISSNHTSVSIDNSPIVTEESIKGLNTIVGEKGTGTNAEIFNDYRTDTDAAGNTATGSYSHAEGMNTTASGNDGSHAEGKATIASGSKSHAEGETTSAVGASSHAEGIETAAVGNASHTEGYHAYTAARFTHAEGKGSTKQTDLTADGLKAAWNKNFVLASAEGAHAEGENTLASGVASHAEGAQTQATASTAHAEGNSTIASEAAAHAEGKGGQATGVASHVEGELTQATKKNAHAEGYKTWADANQAHAEGEETKALAPDSHAEGYNTTVGENANTSHAEGHSTEIYTKAGHVEGYKTIVNVTPSNPSNDPAIPAAHAEGIETEVYAAGGHAEGHYSKVAIDANQGHAEGTHTTVSGVNGHAEGEFTTAAGGDSHAEGYWTEAAGKFSHAEGLQNKAYGSSSHVEGGRYRGPGLATQTSRGGGPNVAYAPASHVEGTSNRTGTDIRSNTDDATFRASVGAHAEGQYTWAKGKASHAEGSGYLVDTAYTLDTTGGTILEGSGDKTCEGWLNDNAAGIGEGDILVLRQTTSGKTNRYYEIIVTNFENGKISFIGEIDIDTIYTIQKAIPNEAIGNYSHVSGLGTKATAEAQTVIGKYNAENNDALFIVGAGFGPNGTPEKLNALEVGQSKINIYATNDGDSEADISIKAYTPAGDGISEIIISSTPGPGSKVKINSNSVLINGAEVITVNNLQIILETLYPGLANMRA